MDSAQGTKEEKLLHLRQYLSGEPLRIIQSLGFSDGAYDAALLRLSQRYGGEDREYRNALDEISRFRTIRIRQLKDLEGLDELTYDIIIKFKAMKKENELKDGFLYQSLLKKLPEVMVINWNRKRIDQNVEKTVETLARWIHEETIILRNSREELQNTDERQS